MIEAMTLVDYMNAKKFPITTQEDLSPLDQFFIDSVNYDTLKKFKLEGSKFDEEQALIWDELSQKISVQARLQEEAEIASEGYNYD
jgi:hypothetical protein